MKNRLNITRNYRPDIYFAPWNEKRLIKSEVTTEEWDKYEKDCKEWNIVYEKAREAEGADIQEMYDRLIAVWSPNQARFTDISVNSYDKKHE